MCVEKRNQWVHYHVLLGQSFCFSNDVLTVRLLFEIFSAEIDSLLLKDSNREMTTSEPSRFP